MSLWVPPNVQRELREQTIAQSMFNQEVAHRTGLCVEFTRELRKIDEHMEMVWWPESASAPGFIPGRYHVVRNPPGAPGTVHPIVDELGGYLEPTSRIFEQLRGWDMWNAVAMRDRKEFDRRADDARRRAEERETEERREEIYERWRAATQTSISMNRDSKWSQNVQGRKGVKRGS